MPRGSRLWAQGPLRGTSWRGVAGPSVESLGAKAVVQEARPRQLRDCGLWDPLVTFCPWRSGCPGLGTLVLGQGRGHLLGARSPPCCRCSGAGSCTGFGHTEKTRPWRQGALTSGAQWAPPSLTIRGNALVSLQRAPKFRAPLPPKIRHPRHTPDVGDMGE